MGIPSTYRVPQPLANCERCENCEKISNRYFCRKGVVPIMSILLLPKNATRMPFNIMMDSEIADTEVLPNGVCDEFNEIED